MNPLFRYVRKSTGFVEDICSVGDIGEQSVYVVLINTLREESDNSEEIVSIGSEFLEHRGGQRKFDNCGQALVAVRPEYMCTVCVPLPRQSIVIPHVVRCGGGE